MSRSGRVGQRVESDQSDRFGPVKPVNMKSTSGELDFNSAESLIAQLPTRAAAYVDKEDTVGLGTTPGTRWCGRCRKPINDRRDVFFAGVETDWVTRPGGLIAHKCKTLIEPSKLILLTAQRFIQTFLGSDFIALHFRQHEFLKFCVVWLSMSTLSVLVEHMHSSENGIAYFLSNVKNPSCFYPIPQAADCITRMVERANTPIIYLSTDAAESETGLLQSMIVLNGKTIPLVKWPPCSSAEKWDALLYRHGIEDDPQCCQAVHFGMPSSAFALDRKSSLDPFRWKLCWIRPYVLWKVCSLEPQVQPLRRTFCDSEGAGEQHLYATSTCAKVKCQTLLQVRSDEYAEMADSKIMTL
ncbi:putative leucine-rich repeat receptor-like protein kinase [Hibiscus syriacus]|uniref:Leucine-rich repeat receptor-like protein kinase n=1 Tax=Hibiscus syriacus TaxID=106335 RepID=A0A6A3CYE9_HIBSY|nr:putative leucine-rich repeat receptor-like protein kinase [Hibiscus syriacus]